MTFEEWLESDDGILRFGRELRPVWIADARIGWNAAIEAAARVCEARGDKIGGAIDPHITAKDVRALSSNETPNA